MVQIGLAQPCAEQSLLKLAPFPVGVAVNTDKLRNEQRYWETALSQFNSFTPEKILKAQFIHRSPNYFDFSEVDRLMAFCGARGIRIHGHTLVWHKALPGWIEGVPARKAAWDSLLKQYITTIISHCKEHVTSWDVVNEAFNEDGSFRSSIWLERLGPEYISKSFQYAREADSAATLFYNDYGLEKNGLKLNAVLQYLDNMQKKGIKADGVGLQMHVTLSSPPIDEINAAALRIANLGYLVHYSELDVALTGSFLFPGKKKLDRQKNRFKEIVQGYCKIRAEARFGITVWGVSDADSWLNDKNEASSPLLYNQRYRIKPAYCGFVEGLSNQASSSK
jgi:endo-1,4-beta-xylanase